MKRVLITGSTDGIGLKTAEQLVERGVHVLIHGRDSEKLRSTVRHLLRAAPGAKVDSFLADLSDLSQVSAMAKEVKGRWKSLDVLVNNAGVFRAKRAKLKSGVDLRFVVNTLAPYLLTRALMPLLGEEGLVINLSSAAQSPVDILALRGERSLSEFEAYAQSKLALTQWNAVMAREEKASFISVNPGSMLGTKMVKEGFGVAGGDIEVGARILVKLVMLSDPKVHTGKYFDNDVGRFSAPHSDALDLQKSRELVKTMDEFIANCG